MTGTIAVDARNDAFSIGETQDISANLLGNDVVSGATASAVGLKVVSVTVPGLGTVAVGTAFTVTTASGRTGTARVNADGTFTFDGGNNFTSLVSGQTDSFTLNYTIQGQQTTPGGTVICVEAEKMVLNNYCIESYSDATGGKVIKGDSNEWNYASTNFSGQTGKYNVDLRLVDEKDGASTIRILVNGVNISGDVVLNANTQSDGWRTLSFANIAIKAGDKVEIQAYAQGGEHARIDNIKFTSTGQPVTVTDTATVTVHINGEGQALGCVGGRVFLDANGNNLESNGSGGFDAGVSGATVQLLNTSGQVVASTTSNANGEYSFQIAAGDYKVKFIAPSGLEFVTNDVGSDDTIDSDAGPGGITVGAARVVAGQTLWNIDAGLRAPTGCVNGRVFLDANGNNLESNGTGGFDAGVAGATVQLLNTSGVVVATTTSNANGEYSFNIAAGDYKVKFIAPSGLEFVTNDLGSDDTIDSDAGPGGITVGAARVVAGQTLSNIDAGLRSPLAVDAVDDGFSVAETQDISANILANDSPQNGSLTVVGLVANGAAKTIGQSFTVTTEGGRQGTVTVNANGTFTFDGGNNFVGLNEGQTDRFQLHYTAAATTQVETKYNLLFVLDISNSTIGAGGGTNVFNGTGVGDVNGDGYANTVLDAEIQGVINVINKLKAQGVNPANIDIGLVTFSGIASGFATVDAATLGTFGLAASNLIPTLTGIRSGGWTNYEAGLKEGERWLGTQQGDGAQNRLFFLSDGRPVINNVNGQDVLQSTANYGDEVARIAGTFGAQIHAIGIGANSDLAYLNQLDNTGGAEKVLDVGTLAAALDRATPIVVTDQAKVFVTINGQGRPVSIDAVDDRTTVRESEGAGDLETLATGASTILANDITEVGAYAGAVVTVNGVTGNVGQFIDLAAGGRIKINANGTVDFDAAGDFEGLEQGQSAEVAVSYSITRAVPATPDGKFTYHLWDSVPEHYTIHNLPTGPGQFTGTTGTLDLNNLARTLTGSDDTYSIRYTGNFVVGTGGAYTFTVAGDDGIGIWIDGHLVASSDGIHSLRSASGQITLGAGSHTIEVRYFENVGSAGLTLDYAGPDTGGAHASIFGVLNSGATPPAVVTDTAHVIVTVLGENEPVVIDAIDDAFSVGEVQDIAANILVNDLPSDGSLSVVAVAFGGAPKAVGQAFTVTTQGGRQGTVKVNADGTFTFDGGNNFVALINGQTDRFQLTYTARTTDLGGNLIVNGDFESHGALTRTGGSGNKWDTFDSVTGWTTPVGVLEIQQGTHDGTPVIAATNEVLELDSHDSDDTNASVVQSITVTTAGTYRLTLEYSPRQIYTTGAIGSTGSANVWANGVIVGTLAADAVGYRTYTFDLALNAGVNVIGFSGSGTDDTYGALIDNVSLREVLTATDTATVTVVVNGEGLPNVLPQAVADAIATDEDTAATPINVLANDNQGDGPATVVAVSGGTVGQPITLTTTEDGQTLTATATLAANGTLTLVPGAAFDLLDAGESRSFTLTYTLRDANGDHSTATITLVINGLNEGPDAKNNAYATAEDVAVSGNLITDNTGAGVDSDPNGDALVVSAVSGGTVGAAFAVTTAGGRQGTLVVNGNGTFTFTPTGGFDTLFQGQTDTVGFSYTARDPSGATDTAQVLITLNGKGLPNVLPQAVADAIATDEDTAATPINVLANDNQGDGPATVVAVSGGTVGQPITLTTTEDGQTLTATATLAANGTLTLVPGAAFDLLDAGESRSFTLTYTLRDANGDHSTATITLVINGLNEGPDAKNNAYATAEDVAVSGNLITDNTGAGVDSDPNGDALVVSAVSGGTVGAAFAVTTAGGRQGTLVVNGNGTFTFTPTGGFDTLFQGQTDTVGFSYTARDPSGASDTAQVLITLNGKGLPNVLPQAVADAIATDEDTAATPINVLANDNQGDGPATVVAVSGGTVGQPITLTTTEDGQTLTATATLAANGTLTLVPGAAFDLLDAGESRSFTLTYTLRDANGDESSAAITLVLNGLNEGPVATDNAYRTDEETAVAGNILADDTGAGADSDPNGDAITVTAVAGGVVGSGFAVTTAGGRQGTLAVAADGGFAFTPTTGFETLFDGQTDTVSFDYTVTDANGASDTASVTVTIDGIDPTPTAVDDTLTIGESAPGSVNLLANDFGGDAPLEVDSVDNTPGQAGSATTEDGRQVGWQIDDAGNLQVRLLTGAGTLFDGQTDTVTLDYTIADLDGDPSAAQVVVTIAGAGTPPDPTRVISVEGEVDTIGLQSQAIAVLIDITTRAFNTNASTGGGNANGDAISNTALDASLRMLITLANSLVAEGRGAQEIAVIPTGFYAVRGVGIYTAAELKAKSLDGTLTAADIPELGATADSPTVINPATGLPVAGLVGDTINLEVGLAAARDYFSTEDADLNEVIVLTASDGFSAALSGLTPVAGDRVFVSDPTDVVAELTVIGADSDVVYIEAGARLAANDLTGALVLVDSDDVVNVINRSALIALDTLLDDPVQAVLGQLVEFTLAIDGVEVDGIDAADVTANAVGFDFQISLDVDLGDALVEIELGFDTDANGVADEFKSVTGTVSGDTFQFTVDLEALLA